MKGAVTFHRRGQRIVLFLHGPALFEWNDALRTLLEVARLSGSPKGERADDDIDDLVVKERSRARRAERALGAYIFDQAETTRTHEKTRHAYERLCRKVCALVVKVDAVAFGGAWRMSFPEEWEALRAALAEAEHGLEEPR